MALPQLLRNGRRLAALSALRVRDGLIHRIRVRLQFSPPRFEAFEDLALGAPWGGF